MWSKRITTSITRIIAVFIIMSAQLMPAFLFLQEASAAAPIKITAKSHEGQSSTGGYTSGNITTYTEGDPINFRFTLDGNGTTSGDVEVRFTGDDGTCLFFDGSFNLGTHDSSAEAIVTVSDATPTVTPIGAPVATDFDTSSGEWVQTLHVDFPAAGVAVVNYYVTLSDEAGECNGSSQHSRLNPAGGSVSQTGAQNVPVPANQIIELPEIYVEKWVDVDGDGLIDRDGQVDRRATAGEWTFTLDGTTSLQTDANGKVTFVNVTPDGDHVVTESDGLLGYEFLSGSGTNCTFQGSTATANVAAGTTAQDATCIFNNGQQTGSIIIEKQTNPDGDSAQFEFTTDFANNFMLSDGQAKTFEDLAPGTYDVSELAKVGWYQESVVCSDGSAPDSIELDADETVTCVFTNSKYSQLEVQKTTQPTGSQMVFDVVASTTDGEIIGNTVGTVSDATDKTYTVKPGTYNVVESPTNDWEEVSNSCNDVVIGYGETVYCEIVNAQYASFTIVKDAKPNSTQDFVFTGSDSLTSAYTLDDDAGVVGADDTYLNFKKFTLPANRTYTLTEDSINGWVLTDISCRGAGITTNFDARSVSFTLAPGADVSCTFTNTQLASILGTKYEVDADGSSPQGLANWTISLLNKDTNVTVQTTTDVNGNYAFNELLPGNYEVTEVQQDGWTQIDNDDTCENIYIISLSAGDENDGNVFCNFKNGSISGYKWHDLDGDGNVDTEPKLAGWTIFIDENDNQVLDGGEVSTTTDSSGNYSFSNLAPGTYEVCEVEQIGWAQTYPGGNGCQTIELTESGSDLTPVKKRSFGNVKDVTLTLKKHVINDNGGNLTGDDFGIAIEGASPVVFGAPYDVSGETSSYSSSGQYAFKSIPGGQFAISEQDIDGYTEGSWNCTGTNGVAYDGLRVVVTPLGGEEITCEITNDDSAPELTIEKRVINDNGGITRSEEFKLYVNGNWVEFRAGGGPVEDNSAFGPYEGATAGVAYTVTEDELPGYTNEGLICIDSDTQKAVTHPVVLLLDQHVRCTITNNDQQAYIKVVKEVINDNGGLANPDDFNLKLSGNSVLSEQLVAVDPGLYIASETQIDGYTFEGFSDDCNDLGFVSVALGETKTCTLTNNDQQAYITVYKDVTNDNGGSAEPDDFKLTLNGNPVLSGVSMAVNPGEYYVKETLLQGYVFEGVSGDCDDSGKIVIGLGESKSCTIYNNDQQAYIKVVKKVINDNGGTAQPNDFNLSLNGIPVSSGDLIPVDPGLHYADEEVLVSGYTFEGFSDDCDSFGAVTIALGETKTCTLTNNDITPKLIVKKVVINDDGGLATQDDFQAKINTVDVDWGVAYDVDAGESIQISETQQYGYEASEWECSGGELVVDNDYTYIKLALAENVTCTITNDDIAPTLTVYKTVDNDNSGKLTANDFGIRLNSTTLEFVEVSSSGSSTRYVATPTIKANTNYTLSEEDIVGYDEGYWTCSDESEGNFEGVNFSVGLSEEVTCWITNEDTPHPQIHVKKDGPATAKTGEKVTYTFTVTNTGDVPLNNIVVEDTITGVATYVSGDTNNDDILDLDETWLFEGEYTIPDGQVQPVKNTVTACGYEVFKIDVEMNDQYFTSLLNAYETVDLDQQNPEKVCDSDDHTTTIPQVLAEVTPPKVLAVTGKSVLLTMLVSVSIVFAVIVLQKTVASDE